MKREKAAAPFFETLARPKDMPIGPKPPWLHYSAACFGEKRRACIAATGGCACPPFPLEIFAPILCEMLACQGVQGFLSLRAYME